MTFFKNLQSNSLPTGISFQSNATKFPQPRLHIAVNAKAEPKTGAIKVSPNKTLQSFIMNVAASPKIHVPVTAAIIRFQLQLYVLTIIRVALRRIHKPLGESPHFVSLNTVLNKGYKESQFYKFTVTVANEPYTNQLHLQKSTWFLFTSVYFDTTVF